jgi:hypothetical protein
MRSGVAVVADEAGGLQPALLDRVRGDPADQLGMAQHVLTSPAAWPGGPVVGVEVDVRLGQQEQASAWAAVPRWAASWRTDSAEAVEAAGGTSRDRRRPPAGHRLLGRRPTSRRWHVLRATTMGACPVETGDVHDQGGQEHPIHASPAASASGRARGPGCSREGGEGSMSACPAARPPRQLGQGPLQDAGDHQQPPRRRALLKSWKKSARSERVQRSGPLGSSEPIHDRRAGDRLAAPDGDLEGDLQHPSGGGSATSSIWSSTSVSQPSGGRAAGGGVRLAALAQLQQPLAEEGRRGRW